MSSDPFLESYFLCLTWRVLKPITHVPHFQGALWSALFRHAANDYLRSGEDFHHLDLRLEPADTGVVSYAEGDRIDLGLALPVFETMRVAEMLTVLTQHGFTHGQFEPGKTIALESVVCRRSGADWPSPDARPVGQSDLSSAAENWRPCDPLDLWFQAPLRLTKPKGEKGDGRYADEPFFREREAAAALLKNALGLDKLQLVPSDCFGTWLDVFYGRTSKPTTLGGFVGRLRLTGGFDEADRKALLKASLEGIGKNRAFGFGRFSFEEQEALLGLQPLRKHRRLWGQLLNQQALGHLLDDMGDGSAGPDGLTVREFQHMADTALAELCACLKGGRYQPGPARTIAIAKRNGGTRWLNIGNVSDRLLQKRVAKLLAGAVQPLLSEAAFAYREGFGRERALAVIRQAKADGFHFGIKADIQAFFDAISRDRMAVLLRALFPREPLIELVIQWFPPGQGDGLTQGNPLSPLLSNLFLDVFDRALMAQGLKLIRYADDFLLLTKDAATAQRTPDLVAEALGRLDLKLAPGKTRTIRPGHAFSFLGYRLCDGALVAADQKAEAIWFPLHHTATLRGQVVYVTASQFKAYNEGASLVLEGKSRNVIPWRAIRAIVVVGRPRLSTGVIARALQKKVPIYFQRLLGGPSGMLSPEPQPHRGQIIHLQRARFTDPGLRLTWAKRLIAAKACNRLALLKRHGLGQNISPAQIRNQVDAVNSLESLRGVEGSLGVAYFREFAQLVEPFTFHKRVYRPPDGPVNAMLSLAYMLLHHRLDAALQREGLDTRSGFFHEGRGSHAALTSDLLEEIRYLADRVVVSVIRMQIIKPSDFQQPPNGGPATRLDSPAFRKFLMRFEHSMTNTFQSSGNRDITYNAYLDQIAEKVCAALKLNLVYEPRS